MCPGEQAVDRERHASRCESSEEGTWRDRGGSEEPVRPTPSIRKSAPRAFVRAATAASSPEATGGLGQRLAHLRAREQAGDGTAERLALHNAVGCERGDPRCVLARQPALERRAAQDLLDGVAGTLLPGRGVEHRRNDALGDAALDDRPADDLRERASERRVDGALAPRRPARRGPARRESDSAWLDILARRPRAARAKRMKRVDARASAPLHGIDARASGSVGRVPGIIGAWSPTPFASKWSSSRPPCGWRSASGAARP